MVGSPPSATAARCLISESRAKASGSKAGTTVGRSSPSPTAGRSGGVVLSGGGDGTIEAYVRWTFGAFECAVRTTSFDGIGAIGRINQLVGAQVGL